MLIGGRMLSDHLSPNYQPEIAAVVVIGLVIERPLTVGRRSETMKRKNYM